MDIELVGNLFKFAGGIGMFLYGMNINFYFLPRDK